MFISEHPKSQFEIVATDYRPVAEVQFSKRRLDNLEVNFEDVIAVKGIKAQGNQLTTDKIKQVNLLDSLPYEEPEELTSEEIEVVEEEVVSDETLPLEITNLEKSSDKPTLLSSEEKAERALQKTIEKKKADQKAKDDESQTTLF